jgi:hypothetical protein
MPGSRGARAALILFVVGMGLTAATLAPFGGAAAQQATPIPGATTTPLPPTAAAIPAASSPEQAYLEWLQAHQARELTVVQAVPTTLDLTSPGWRRDLALALDSWGALIQQARDQRPPASAQPVHRTLLDALDALDQARRLLLVAAATGQDPGPELTTTLEQGRRGLAQTTAQAQALTEGRPLATVRPAGTRGNLRVTVLAATRPYTDKGTPGDPGFEYLTLRLRLESVAGEPVLYDAFHFRVRTADQTEHPPAPLALPDELLYGALEGNRLAGEIVGNVAFPVRIGVPALALTYSPDGGDPALVIPLGDPLPTSTPGRSASTGS